MNVYLDGGLTDRSYQAKVREIGERRLGWAKRLVPAVSGGFGGDGGELIPVHRDRSRASTDIAGL
jgi:hypothetical protein